mgnify:CR=1 FL=1
MEDLFGFTAPDVTRIENVVNFVEKNPQTGLPIDDVREVPLRRLQIVLKEELAGTSDYNVPTSARATVKVGLDAVEALGNKDPDITVWNRFSASYAVGTFLHVVEVDEDDRWYAVSTGGSGNQTIKFVILGPSAAIGQGAIGCDYVTAEVTRIGCDASGVQIGDTVNIWDPDYCYLNMPLDLLVGLRGTAQSMQNNISAIDAAELVDCQYEVLAAGACRWEVTSLCCAEEFSYL